jgi:hypothetical protein
MTVPWRVGLGSTPTGATPGETPLSTWQKAFGFLPVSDAGSVPEKLTSDVSLRAYKAMLRGTAWPAG